MANVMGHDLRPLSATETFRLAMLAWLIVFGWSLLFEAPAPEAFAAALLAMFFHEAGVSLTKLSGWVFLLGVLLVSRPIFGWILGVVSPGEIPVA